MKGIVKDTGTGLRLSDVQIYLLDKSGTPLQNKDGYVGTQSNDKGVYEIEFSQQNYLMFQRAGYPPKICDYEQLAENPNVYLNDGSGSALTKNEVKTFMHDYSKAAQGRTALIVGVSILVLLIVLIFVNK